jgi:predicted AAA+ superfamily ATPase
LTPFSLLELQSIDIQQSTHWFNGGFPDALLAPEPRFARLWLQNFIYTFMEKDIRMLGYDINIPTMDKLLKMLSHLHSTPINVSDVSRSLSISAPTINKYLDLLEGGFYCVGYNLIMPILANGLLKRLKYIFGIRAFYIHWQIFLPLMLCKGIL